MEDRLCIRYRRLLLSVTVMAPCVVTAAQDRVGTFVWDAPTQALFDNADPERGREIAESKCSRCHGDTGITPPEDQDVPNLAGQHAAYLFKQAKDYQAETRENRGMRRRVEKLSDQEMVDIATWYASLTPAIQDAGRDVPALITEGNPDRKVPGCATCHGADGAGQPPLVPRLAGQKALYLELALQDFRAGIRRNLDASTIRVFKTLTDQEIDIAVKYFSGL